MDDLALAAVIPVYNGEGFLRRAVESVRRQTLRSTSIVIVDDCSTDGSAGVAQSLAESDPRIRLLRMPVNGGPSAARNAALRMVDEPLVAFLDADDEWLPHHLESLVGALASTPSASVAFSRAHMARDAAPRERLGNSTARLVSPLPRLFRENFIVQSAVLVRPDAVLRAGGYPEHLRYGEDYDLWLRLAVAGAQFVEVPATGCVRTAHDGQVSLRNAGRMYTSAWQTRRRTIDALYASPADIPADTLTALIEGVRDDLRGAWNSRRRDVLRDAIDATAWVPGIDLVLAPWRSRLGYQWKFWRALTLFWDRVPAPLKRLTRRLPEQSLN